MPSSAAAATAVVGILLCRRTPQPPLLLRQLDCYCSYHHHLSDEAFPLILFGERELRRLLLGFGPIVSTIRPAAAIGMQRRMPSAAASAAAASRLV